MRNLKNTKGITLVALIITIIVLLILAMVSISLVINSGIITKSKSATDTYSAEEIGEQLKLAYSEYQMAVYSEGANDATAFVKARLKTTFGDSLDENSVSVANGKVSAKINGKTYEYDASTGVAGEAQVIKYYDSSDNEIAKTDTTHLDYLIIGGTERFKVISTTSGILALSYYGIELKEDHPIQSTDIYNADKFSTAMYWCEDDNGNDISGWNDKAVNGILELDIEDMNNPKNRIQKYINAYKKTLEDMGATGIEVKLPNYSDLTTEGVTNDMRNPAQLQRASWIAAVKGDPMWKNRVYRIANNGSVSYQMYNDMDTFVRPVIIIP